MKFGLDQLVCQLSIKFNRVKVKMLNSSVAMDDKKLFIANLRPSRLKIKDILVLKDWAINV
jgi:hypothetical protein